jgi:hypothetical protein
MSQTAKAFGKSAIECLVERLIDYAGLFPPASLNMRAAVANYAAYSRSESSWVLGRFIVPAARLIEFEEALGALPNTGTDSVQWDLSVLLGADPAADVDHIHKFNVRRAALNSGTKAVIDSVEAKASSADEVRLLDALIPNEFTGYFEIPLSGRLRETIAAVEDCRGRRVKIRTGGETADKFPPPEAVVEFLRLCMATVLSFKATAGLHHPVRSVHRFTYQPDSPAGIMHGFLNVFLAAAFLRRGMDAALAVDVLKEESPSAFRFDAEGISWREHRLDTCDLLLARRDFAISFGSCSFTEPIDDLRSLHLL